MKTKFYTVKLLESIKVTNSSIAEVSIEVLEDYLKC